MRFILLNFDQGYVTLDFFLILDKNFLNILYRILSLLTKSEGFEITNNIIFLRRNQTKIINTNH